MEGPKITIFDLETLPNMKEAMKVWPQLSNYPGLTLKATITSIICMGWKRYGEKKTHCINAWDYSARWKKDVNDDYELVKAARDVLKDSDAVITYNGKRFDWKHLQTRILYHGLEPLHNIHHIDAMQVAKRHLYAFNNRLTTIAQLTTDDDKLDHGEGWDLWVKVSERDPKAMKLMEKYCKQDVVVLEKVYNVLRPLINNIPNHNIYTHAERVCPNCGSMRIISNGWRTTKTGRYKRYLCQNCGTSSRTDTKDQMPRTF